VTDLDEALELACLAVQQGDSRAAKRWRDELGEAMQREGMMDDYMDDSGPACPECSTHVRDSQYDGRCPRCAGQGGDEVSRAEVLKAQEYTLGVALKKARGSLKRRVYAANLRRVRHELSQLRREVV